jgi:hypothetical protein
VLKEDTIPHGVRHTMGSEEWKQAMAEARKVPLIDLAESVVWGTYTPGVEDEVLIERIKKLLKR